VKSGQTRGLRFPAGCRNLRPDLHEARVLRMLLPAALLLLAAGSAPTLAQSDEQFRQEFSKLFGAQCVVEQKKALAATTVKVSDDFITRYCGCFGQRLSAVVSVQEMRQISSTGVVAPETQSRMTAMGQACIAAIREEDRARQSPG
jgi:hypothetical protein